MHVKTQLLLSLIVRSRANSRTITRSRKVTGNRHLGRTNMHNHCHLKLEGQMPVKLLVVPLDPKACVGCWLLVDDGHLLAQPVIQISQVLVLHSRLSLIRPTVSSMSITTGPLRPPIAI